LLFVNLLSSVGAIYQTLKGSNMAAWNIGKVVEHKQWSPTLHTLYVESEIEPYRAGQFVKIGLEVDGVVIAHPYSLCNAPQHNPLEIYYVEVPGGALTSRLVKLKAGDSILVSPRANGFMVLDEVPEAKHLWLMATGTGVGPFLSILDTAEPWQRFERAGLCCADFSRAELSITHCSSAGRAWRTIRFHSFHQPGAYRFQYGWAHPAGDSGRQS
jgi:ferredoxin--NADP+ reductase